MKIRKPHYIRLSCMMIIMLMIFTSCTKENIKIGFIGDMTSKNSQLAVDVRNAVEFGVREINEQGGINGREIELIIKDDANDYDVAIKCHEEFKEEGVKFIVGHTTSSMGEAVLYSQSEELLFVSPTMGSSLLSNLDDYFIRTSSININQANVMSEYFDYKEIEDVVFVYDLMNEEYTRNLYEKFESIYVGAGHTIGGVVPFDSRTDQLEDVANEILEFDSEHIVFISQATDTAFLMQYLKQRSNEFTAYSVMWSMSNDLIQNGGKYVDGMIFIGVYKPETESDDYKKFATEFEADYGYKPSFLCVLGYDAFKALAYGLSESKTLEPEQVKEAIISKTEYVGLNEIYSMDKYGDNDRQYILYQLDKDSFIPLRDWKN